MKWLVKWYIPGENGPLVFGTEEVDAEDEGDTYREVVYRVCARHGDVAVNCSQAKAAPFRESRALKDGDEIGGLKVGGES